MAGIVLVVIVLVMEQVLLEVELLVVELLIVKTVNLIILHMDLSVVIQHGLNMVLIVLH